MWRTIPSFPDFEASSEGNIRGGKRGGVKKQHIHKTGRWHVRIGQKVMGVHVLVCEAFHGVRTVETDTVDHINRNPLDNHPENLRWASRVLQARNNSNHINKGLPLYINSYTNYKGIQYYAIKVEIPGTREKGGRGRKFEHKSLNIENYTLNDAITERNSILDKMGLGIPDS